MSILHEILLRHTASNQETAFKMQTVFAEFYASRKPNTDAIANMALENFTEMMAKTADRRFLLEKEIEIELTKMAPTIYISRYALITHSLLPYDLCRQVGIIQQDILSALSANLDSVLDLDREKALGLLTSQLEPFLARYNITHDSCHYTSKYYLR